MDAKVASDPEAARRLAEVCTEAINNAEGRKKTINEENLDECTLCDLCLEAAPKGSVRVVKLYES